MSQSARFSLTRAGMTYDVSRALNWTCIGFDIDSWLDTFDLRGRKNVKVRL
jgi:hypothetical protein